MCLLLLGEIEGGRAVERARRGSPGEGGHGCGSLFMEILHNVHRGAVSSWRDGRCK